ncbi:MAG: hypothetical protein KNN13_02220 [Hydrogenobacter thermophilus]|uniref:hypothetical protein n=1 Tax=Hydrogenobacter thermophilus TaxID=940 RepID=UPI001C795E7A|nr:hypothetical protein [Hydrogenobacter thermophilus]QWK20169.1 MAG: hypothetical protein KNN13_02220 [Hydrogenobacter thermophilus]
MNFIRTRSGRYLNTLHVISLSVEEAKIEVDGRKRVVYKVVAYMSQPLLPAVLGIYSTEEKAFQVLESIVQKLSQDERVIILESEY